MNQNDAALVSPSGNVAGKTLRFEARTRREESESPIRSPSGGWKRPDSAPSSRGSSRASSFSSARRPEIKRPRLPSPWRQSFSGLADALSTVHESTSTQTQTEAVGSADISTQTGVIPESMDGSTQANIAPDYESTHASTQANIAPAYGRKLLQTDMASKTTSSAQTNPVPESTSTAVQTLHQVPEITSISTRTESYSPKPQRLDRPETRSTSTQTASFSPKRFVARFGLSSYDKIKRSLSWPTNNKNVDDDTDSADDASTIVEDELPIRLFGNGEPVDPVIKAFQLQDSVDVSLDELSPTKERDKGLAVSKATLRWLREHEPGQRRWASNESDPPCAVCHATREDAARSVLDDQLAFCSSLNLRYNDSEQYAWSFGSRYVVLERQYWNLKPGQLPAEVWASRLLKKHTKVPTPAVVAAWKEGHVAITITERAKGQPLAEVWSSMAEARRTSIAKQAAGHVQDWRRIKANKIAALDGGLCFRDDFGKDAGAEKVSIKDDAQYRAFVQEKIVAQGWKQVIAEMAVELIPACQPFVFTHGNLTMDNIFVREGRVVAITGLGKAAYLPVWAESLETHQAYGEAEREWKEMLFKYIGSEGVKAYYNIYAELMQADEAAIKEKTQAMQNKLTDLLGPKRVRDAELELEALEREMAGEAQKAAQVRKAEEEEEARRQKEKYSKKNALQRIGAEGAAQMKKQPEGYDARMKALREAARAQRKEETKQARKADGKEDTQGDQEESSPEEEVKIATQASKENTRGRGFGHSRKGAASHKPRSLVLGQGAAANPRRGLFGNNLMVDPKATVDSSSTKEEKPAPKYYSDGTRPRKDPIYHGVPFSPGTIAKRKRSSVFLAVAGTRARQMYPNGFHILGTREGGEVFTGPMEQLGPIMRPVFDSVLAQIADSKIKLTDLGMKWFDAMEDMEKRGGVGNFRMHQKMALTLRMWGASREDPLDLCLGCVLNDGREWVDSNDAQAPWSENVIWIMSFKNGTILPTKDFRGLSPSTRKLSNVDGTEAA